VSLIIRTIIYSWSKTIFNSRFHVFNVPLQEQQDEKPMTVPTTTKQHLPDSESTLFW